MSVMCQDCGVPHVPIFCPHLSRYFTRCYANPYVQPQPYFSQGYSSYQYEEPYQQPQQQNFEVYEQVQVDRIMRLLVQLLATDETNQRMIQEHEVMLQNQQSRLSNIRYSIEEIARRL